ncbi:hypothetical protein ACFL0Q_04670 [Thermodesulfobacteriota bacterium]
MNRNSEHISCSLLQGTLQTVIMQLLGKRWHTYTRAWAPVKRKLDFSYVCEYLFRGSRGSGNKPRKCGRLREANAILA